MALEPFISSDLTFVLDRVSSRDELFALLAAKVSAKVPGLNSDALLQRLIDRERQMPTSTPEGIAFPHAIAPEINRTLLAVARVDEGVDFGAEDHPRCRLIFCMFGSSRDPWEHVRLLARLSRICRTEKARSRLRACDSAERLHASLLEEDRSHDS